MSSLQLTRARKLKLQEDMVMDAQVLLARMQESPHVSARPGWLVLLQSLLRRGHHRKVGALPNTTASLGKRSSLCRADVCM
jgi:hypothetical protein